MYKNSTNKACEGPMHHRQHIKKV